MTVKNWLRFAALGVVWGSSFLWIKLAMGEIGPFTLVAFRVLFAFLGLAAFALFTRASLAIRSTAWRPLVVLGIVNVVLPFGLIAWSELYIDSGMAAVLNSSVPLFTALIAAAALKEERLTLPKLVGLAAGFAGVLVLTWRSLTGIESGSLPGQIGMLLASLCYAAGAVYARRYTRVLSVEVLTLGQMGVATLFMGIAAPLVEAPFAIPLLPLTWSAILWLGLLGSCLGNLLFFALIQDVGPTRATLPIYLIPLVGVILGVIFLDERLNWQFLAGGALIILGIAIVNSTPSLSATVQRALGFRVDP